MTYTTTDNNDGVAAREALVERVTNELAANLSPHQRALIMGGVRLGVIEAAREIAQAYPQLAEHIYEKFGMSGWGEEKPSPRHAIPNDGLKQEEGHHAAQTSTLDNWPRGPCGRKPR